MAAGDVNVALTSNSGRACNEFDGVDDYIQIAHHTSLLGKNFTKGMTLSAWVKPDSVGEGAGRIVDKSNGGSGGSGFFMSMNNGVAQAVMFGVAAGGNVSTALGSVPYKSNWTHVLFTCTYAGAVVSYANGAVSGAGGNTGSLVNNTTTNAMRIGNYVPATTSTFDGCIRHFKIWNKILSSTEIAADYAGNTPTDSLVCWYKLGGDYANYGSGGAGTGTNSGSVGIIGDGAIAVAVKAQRKGATDKWLCYKGVGGQVGTIEIEA